MMMLRQLVFLFAMLLSLSGVLALLPEQQVEAMQTGNISSGSTLNGHH